MWNIAYILRTLFISDIIIISLLIFWNHIIIIFWNPYKNNTLSILILYSILYASELHIWPDIANVLSCELYCQYVLLLSEKHRKNLPHPFGRKMQYKCVYICYITVILLYCSSIWCTWGKCYTFSSELKTMQLVW